MSDDERPRKSWREIDRSREKSQHRKEERSPGEQKRRGPQGQKSYRAALDKLFETGKIAELVEQKAPATATTSQEGESRFKMLARIKKAVDRATINTEIDAYLKQYELPDDLEILEKVLEHRSPALQREAMERIDHLLDQAQPKRCRTMLGLLKLIRDVGDDKELTDLASKLIRRLE